MIPDYRLCEGETSFQIHFYTKTDFISNLPDAAELITLQPVLNHDVFDHQITPLPVPAQCAQRHRHLFQ